MLHHTWVIGQEIAADARSSGTRDSRFAFVKFVSRGFVAMTGSMDYLMVFFLYCVVYSCMFSYVHDDKMVYLRRINHSFNVIGDATCLKILFCHPI